MKPQYRDMRLAQLSTELAAFQSAKEVPRPVRGWLRAIREALGLSLEHVGRAAGASRQRIQRFEKAEAGDRITLRNLRRVAEAMDCVLVYAIVPKSSSLAKLAEQRARTEAAERVHSVEHTMALENQASGGLNELIEQETRRIFRKR